MAWLRRNGIAIFGILAIAYMLVPIVVIAVFSFNDPSGKFNFTWQGFTFEHWQNAFSIPALNEAFVTSLILAALATLVATIFGTMIALALVRYQFRGRTPANFLIVLPLATPEVVIGASLLSMFVYFEVARGFTTLLIAHIMFSISFVVIVVRSRLIGFDRSINPYRGCEHGCAYCFARPSHAFLGLSPGLDFETKLFAKPEAPSLLARFGPTGVALTTKIMGLVVLVIGVQFVIDGVVPVARAILAPAS